MIILYCLVWLNLCSILCVVVDLGFFGPSLEVGLRVVGCRGIPFFPKFPWPCLIMAFLG